MGSNAEKTKVRPLLLVPVRGRPRILHIHFYRGRFYQYYLLYFCLQGSAVDKTVTADLGVVVEAIKTEVH